MPQPDTGPGQRFEDLALPHLDAAYNLARWLVRDPVLADDVVQDAMLRALKYFANYPWRQRACLAAADRAQRGL